ncbi:MAG TPA: hypothetical protein VMM82_01250 [Spirochaetia bacterium]|nr:hypothetical protein [Spirochaetia bacterium]
MKKILAAAVLLALSPAAFAADFSIGAGGSIGLLSWQDLKGSFSGAPAENVERGIPIDIKIFADITTIQFSFGYLFVTAGNQATSVLGATTTTALSSFASYLTFAAYGKYPFTFGSISIFPVVGLEYRLNLTWTVGGQTRDSLTSAERVSLNELWLRGGAGMDISFGKMYLRSEVLLGFKPILGAFDADLMQAAGASGWTSLSTSYFSADASILIGYKL